MHVLRRPVETAAHFADFLPRSECLVPGKLKNRYQVFSRERIFVQPINAVAQLCQSDHSFIAQHLAERTSV
jgi:hypothetical protein